MSVKFLFRVRYIPESQDFEVICGPQTWHIKPEAMEKLVNHAKSQLADVTDVMTEFTLQVDTWKINLHGITSRKAFQGIVEYLDKVWDSYKGSDFDSVKWWAP